MTLHAPFTLLPSVERHERNERSEVVSDGNRRGVDGRDRMKWLLVCWKEEKETRSDPFLRPRPTHVHSLVTLVHSVSETVGNTRGMGMVWIDVRMTSRVF